MAAETKRTYTASFAFFEALCEAGITHIFVNLGSDHPAIMEAIVRGQNEIKADFPRIITCPNEMVALSMADGYARLTGKPQCVIVHVDVGTQALAAAVHNASCGRAPVLIFAGLSPHTIEGEYRGSRTEFIHWLQDVPDQKQLVAQYCRYTAEIKAGRNIKQIVNRALQFATSDPQGPVYLCGARETMEELIEPYSLDQSHWEPVVSGPLTGDAVELVSDALINATSPLLIVGYSGRKAEGLSAAVGLANLIPGLKVLDCGGSEVCFPANHPAYLGFTYGVHEEIEKADFILVVDCDVPWIPTRCKPALKTKIIHIDIDPLKQQMPVYYIPASARFKADSALALNQIQSHIKLNLSNQLDADKHRTSGQEREKLYNTRQQSLQELAKPPSAPENSAIQPHFLAASIKAAVPSDTIFAIEAVTLTGILADQIAPVLPKSWINCGGGGLGWSGGGALGIKLATDFQQRSSDNRHGTNQGRFVCQIVGDGTYMFSVPSSVYWIAGRYDIPVLTIVLNNKGWNAPRKSLLLVHPDGAGSKVNNVDLHISFDPTPDYAGIAKAATAGKSWAGCAKTVNELLKILPEAIQAVQSGVAAVLEIQLETV